MTRNSLLLSVLALAIAGCASPPPPSGNPFNEGVRVVPSPRIPTHSQTHAATAPTAAAQPSSAIPDLPSSIVVTPAATGLYTPFTESQTTASAPPPAPANGQTTAAHEVMAEARRLGAAGDQDAMLELMQQSAFMGNYDALYELARMYQKGEGVPRDQERANAYLTTGDGQGHFESTRVLAWNYLLGNGLPKDSTYAVSLFEKAMSGSGRAKREYAMLLTNQLKPGLNDPQKGMRLLQEAAAAGDTEAAASLTAVTAPSNVKPSPEMLETAGESRPQTSQAKTAPVNPVTTEAKAEQLKAQALAGNSDAIFDYATGLILGKYPSMDSEFEAYCWYSVAQDRGHPGAKSELAALDGVRTASDRKSPGSMDQCIADLHQAITR